MNNSFQSLFLIYGPPGSGKGTLGQRLAEALSLPFVDLDNEIAARAARSIEEIFARQGEETFRRIEASCLENVIQRGPGVVALGGGALLNEHSHALAESAGQILCLTASEAVLAGRLQAESEERPLLGRGEDWRERLATLLERRAGHYASFPLQLDTTSLSPSEGAWQAQIRLGVFHLSAMGSPYDVRVLPGGLDDLGAIFLQRGWGGPVALVSDEYVGPLYAGQVKQSLESAGYSVRHVTIPAGETHKTMGTISRMWAAFIEAGLDRGSTVVGLGGGVVTDLAGFASSAFLRGVRWVALPTSLLGMVDASLGGKTGVDLPQGKNLVGSFYPPALVLADPTVLTSLPHSEVVSGLGEVIKHGILADEELFERCALGWEALQGSPNGRANWDETVRRAMAVKVRYIETDPYEKGLRAALNLGHTIGHAVELVSNFRLSHGQAVAIGMIVEARLAERMQLAEAGLADRIAAVVSGLGLPARIPPKLDPQRILEAIQVDKKRADGRVRFALPVRIGEVRTGIAVEPNLVKEIIGAGGL